MPTSFIWLIIFFSGASEYGGISNLWFYFGTKAERLYVEFCNVVQCHICVSYLACYSFIKGVLNIRHTNTAAEKLSRLYRSINLFMFKIYNFG
jgi:hypothetical protein